jgi:hypothetical protein
MNLNVINLINRIAVIPELSLRNSQSSLRILYKINGGRTRKRSPIASGRMMIG